MPSDYATFLLDANHQEQRLRELVDVARRARRWFLNDINGTARNGTHDDIGISRTLERVLKQFDDIEPTADQDRAEWRERMGQVPVEVSSTRRI